MHRNRVARGGRTPAAAAATATNERPVAQVRVDDEYPILGASATSSLSSSGARTPVARATSSTDELDDEQLARHLDRALNNRYAESDAALAAAMSRQQHYLSHNAKIAQQHEFQRQLACAEPRKNAWVTALPSATLSSSRNVEGTNSRLPSAASVAAPPPPPPPLVTAATRLKIAQLHHAYPEIEDSVLESVLVMCDGVLERTLVYLRELFPAAVPSAHAALKEWTNIDYGESAIAAHERLGAQAAAEAAVAAAAADADADEWQSVRTGRAGASTADADGDDDDEYGDDDEHVELESLLDKMLRGERVQLATSESYADWRTEAQALVHQRNVAFGRTQHTNVAGASGVVGMAAAAAVRGRLTAHAQDINRQMHAAHRKAVCEIVYRNNKGGDIARRIDLHYLLVKEAVVVTKALLARIRASRPGGSGAHAPHTLSLVTGAGNHSAGGAGRIKPALERLFTSLGLRYSSFNAGELRGAARG